MDYKIYGHRNAELLLKNKEEYIELFREIKEVLNSITDDDLIDKFNKNKRHNIKSLSQPINELIKERLILKGWHSESAIFNDKNYKNGADKNSWRLDFAKGDIAVEVAFNHGEAIAWNLIKPVLASELNHVEKEIQTSIGIVICATQNLKIAGNFDGAVGTFEKFIRYLIPLNDILTTPILIIGLDSPKTFHIDKDTRKIIINK